MTRLINQFSMICFGIYAIYALGNSELSILKSLPAITNVSSFSYSSSALPSGWGPSDSTTYIFQSPGLQVYGCKIPAYVPGSNVTIITSLNNRFGSRFSNSIHGQLILNMVMQHLTNTLYPTWISTLNKASLGTYTFKFTTTSSGPSILLTVTKEQFAKSILLIIGILNDIYAATISKTGFENICSQLTQQISITTTQYTNQEMAFNCFCTPKLDCSSEFITNFPNKFAIPLGSYEGYSLNKITTFTDSLSTKEVTRNCLGLLSAEKSLTMIITTNDSSVIDQIPLQMQTISDAINTTYIKAYSQNYFGYCLPKGYFEYYSRSTGNNSCSAGVIFFGKISPESLVSAMLAIKLIDQFYIDHPQYIQQIRPCIVPMAGQITLRLYVGSTDSEPEQAWTDLMKSLSNRYATNGNDQDLYMIDFLNLIDDACSYLSMDPYRYDIPSDTCANGPMFESSTEGFANWIQVFQGALGLRQSLLHIKIKPPAYRVSFMKKAASVLTESSKLENTFRVHYDI